MNRWLLDTNVLSELRKQRPEPEVTTFIASQPLERLFLSSVTFAEIRFGIEKLADPSRRAEITSWLDNILRPMFDQRVLALSEDVLLTWRLIIEVGRKNGHTFSHPDVLIAATAFHHNLVVVTRNTSEFIAAGVTVLNPWTGETFAA